MPSMQAINEMCFYFASLVRLYMIGIRGLFHQLFFNGKPQVVAQLTSKLLKTVFNIAINN